MRTYSDTLKPYLFLILRLSGIALIAAFLQLPLPLIFKYLVDTVLVSGSQRELVFWVFILLSIIASSNFLNLKNQVMTIQLHNRFKNGLRQSLFKSIQALPFEEYSKYMSGELTSRLIKDLDSIKCLLPGGIGNIAKNSTLSLGFILVLFMLNWKMTLGLSLTLPVFVWLFVITQKKIKILAQTSHHSYSQMQANIQEKMDGIKEIQLTNTLSHQRIQANQLIETSESANAQLQIQQAKFENNIVVFQLMGTFIIWGIGGWMVLHHLMSIGEIIGFSYAVNYVFGPFSALFHDISTLQFELTAIERIMWLNNLDTVESNSNHNILPIKGHVEFKNVSFAYPGKLPVLKNISFQIQPGETNCILGPSGSGKTTLTLLLLKMIHPVSGAIMIDGHNISDIPASTLRQWIGVVPQTVFLFQGTLKDNILMGRDVSQFLWEKACNLSGIKEMVSQLEDGFETLVGEKGSFLSGGQRQKIAIARALVTDPQILVLDEPSNNLDNDAKIRLHQSILLAEEGKSIIVITHDSEITEGITNIIKLKEIDNEKF